MKVKNEASSSFKDGIERYFEKLIASLDQFRISFRGGSTKDLVDLIEKSIDSMQMVNNDFINFLETVFIMMNAKVSNLLISSRTYYSITKIITSILPLQTRFRI